MTFINRIVTFANRLPLPDRAWVIYGLCLVWWVTDFLIEYQKISTHYENLLMSGSLPSNADSISIPIFQYVFGDIALGLIFGCYLIWALWGIQPQNKAINFNKFKPVRSTIGWLLTSLWLFIAIVLFVGRLLDESVILVVLQIISFY